VSRTAHTVAVVLIALLVVSTAATLEAATFNVTTTADAPDVAPGNGICEATPGAGDCTLRAAIMEANAWPGADTIEVPAGNYVLTFEPTTEHDTAWIAGEGDLDILSNLTIAGAGAGVTFIGWTAPTAWRRVVQVANNAVATIEGVTIRNGKSFFGGGIFVEGNAAATCVPGSHLTLRASHVTNNTASHGTGIGVGNSGRLATLTVIDSTISGNFISGDAPGGAIYMSLPTCATAGAAIINSTISHNIGQYYGTHYGGMPGLVAAGPLSVVNSSIVNNAPATAQIWLYPAYGPQTFRNTLIASADPSTPNCYISGTTAPSVGGGFNLSTDTSCALIGVGNMQGVAAHAGPLQDNGGPTLTHALLPGSPAIDAGDDGVVGSPMLLTIDQRGRPRPLGLHVDIGAYERDQVAPMVTAPSPVTIDATSLTGTPASDPAIVAFLAGATASDDVEGTTLPIANDAPADFPLGSTTVTFSATDLSDNTGTASAAVTVVDRPPVLHVPGDITVEAQGPSGVPASDHFVAAFLASATATDVVDGAVPVAHDAPADFLIGPTTVTFTATDSYGNVVSDTGTVTVLDTTPPVIAAHGDVTAEATSPTGAPVTYVAPEWTDLVDGGGTADCAPAPGETFPLGATPVTCSASDHAGNDAVPVTFTVHVGDTTPPVIAAHGDVTAEATSPTGAVVTYVAPEWTDLVDGGGTADCAPAPGETFPLGATPVTCTATDSSGNGATSSFAVLVTGDLDPPIIGAVTPDRPLLWPPNHQLVPVAVSVDVTDLTDPSPVCAVSAVKSNEPLDGTGDGDTSPDWLVAGGLTIQLRAERAGGGSGRVYTMTVQCVDASGNAATAVTMVSVPVSMNGVNGNGGGAGRRVKGSTR